MANNFNVLDGGSSAAFTQTYSTTGTTVETSAATGSAPTNVGPYGWSSSLLAQGVADSAARAEANSTTALKLLNKVIDILQSHGWAS